MNMNVGGMLFSTSRATLEEGQSQSMLAALVSGRHGPPRRDAQVRRGERGGALWSRIEPRPGVQAARFRV